MSTRALEWIIERLLFLCAALSVLTTAGIILGLAVETFEFLREVSIVEFYLKNADNLVREVNYVGLGGNAYQMVLDRFTKKTTGSVFSGQNTVGVTIDQLLAKEAGK